MAITVTVDSYCIKIPSSASRFYIDVMSMIGSYILMSLHCFIIYKSKFQIPCVYVSYTLIFLIQLAYSILTLSLVGIHSSFASYIPGYVSGLHCLSEL